ncbi:MAG: benzoate-CoA ligase family protein, partial [bacterium]
MVDLEAVAASIPESYNASTTFIDDNLAAGRGDEVAIRYEGQTYTYGQVGQMMNRLGNALLSLGVQREQRVILLLLDSPEFAASFFGGMRIGAVPIPTNTLLKAADYRYLFNDSRVRVLIAHEALMGCIREIRAELKYLEHVIVVGEPQKGEISYEELVEKQPEVLEPTETHKDEIAFWLYSSGSTGFPKGAVHLHHDMVYCSDLYARNVLDINENDRTFSVAKLFFAYGLGNNLYFPFRVGGSCVLYPHPPKPEEMFKVIDREKPTLFYCVPTMYAAMLQIKDAEERFDLSSLRLCVSAGEALPAELFNQWKERFGVEILDGIGSTEMLHIYLTNWAGRVKPGSSGSAVPGYDVKIVDEEGTPVPDGEVGNLWVMGESCSPFYWNKHAETKRAMRGEWFVSGDKYYRDEEGHYWYCGRSDDMLKVGGIWVSPVEVENTLIEHPAVLEAAVVGREDDDGLTKPKAYVVLAEGHTGSEDLAQEMMEFVRERIAAYKRPRWLEFLEALPKTATGKI